MGSNAGLEPTKLVWLLWHHISPVPLRAAVSEPPRSCGSGSVGGAVRNQAMVARMELSRFLCRNKPYHRFITAYCFPPLGCPPIDFPHLDYFMPQSVMDGGKSYNRLDSMSYRLQHVNPAVDCCPSHLNMEGTRNLNLSKTDNEEDGSMIMLHRAAACSAIRLSPLPRLASTRAAACPDTRSSPLPGLASTSALKQAALRSLGSRSFSTRPDKDKLSSPFVVEEGDSTSLLNRIEAAIDEKRHEYTEQAIKERYRKHVRPQLNSRGLILPDQLQDRTTRYIHFRSKGLTGRRPLYMHSCDVMGHEKRMKTDEWKRFLKFMVKTRIFVIERWDSSISHVESLMYDYGINAPDDGTGVEFYKAECDAAYDEKRKVANLSFLIFNKARDIIQCRVYYDFPCESSVLAEAYAALALLMTAHQMEIKKLVFWTDNEATHEVVSGERNVKLSDKHLGIYMLLREQKKLFDKVISMWKGREVNLLADEISTFEREMTLALEFPLRAFERWADHMKGSPVFRFKQKNDVTTIAKNFADDQSFGRAAATKAVILDVEQVCKFDILLGLLEGFEPDDLYLAVHEFDKIPKDLQLKIVEFFGEQEELFGVSVGGTTVFHKFKSTSSHRKSGQRKSLTVLFDQNLLGKRLRQSDLTVVLVSPGDPHSIARRSLRSLTALDYARFSQM